MRNANGFGTCYKLKGTRRNPWIARVCTGTGNKGRLKYKTIGYYPSRKDGLTALTDYHRGYLPERSTITLKQLYDEWSTTKYKFIAQPTIENYRAAWLHVKELADLPFQSIRTAHWQKIIDNLKLSRSSLHKIKTLAVMLSDYATQNDITNKNYAQYIKLPKWTRSEKDIFTDAEIKKLKDCTDEWINTVLILIYTGMRISELLNLTKFQVDLKKQLITTGSKTEAGQRVIPINKKILPIIKELYSKADNYIVTEDGNKLTPDIYRKRLYYPALKKAKVERRTPHACRHTFATILAREKVDTLSIQKLMGHADYSLTANVYSHPEVEQLKKAIDKLC